MISSVYRGFSSIGVRGINTELHDVELVKRDILNHFYTRLGERRGRPEFGSIIHDLVMENFTDNTEAKVIADAKRIIRSDPRVSLRDLRVTLIPDSHRIVVSIQLLYRELNAVDWVEAVFGGNT
jgi:phage baseplate assembly protein W